MRIIAKVMSNKDSGFLHVMFADIIIILFTMAVSCNDITLLQRVSVE